ncbi:MAG: Asp23/Gls24 family envelope stress response protein [Christensenellales bacterium]|jgi:uncharacterized alkaline shock family protein YloU
MSENLPTSVELAEQQNGSVTFTTDVVATIAGVSAAEVDGVASMYGSSNTGLVEMISRRGAASGKKNTRGVKAEISGNSVTVHLSVIVDFGCPIPEVAANIQDNVKKAIETMCGLNVVGVDIHVQGLCFEKEERRVAAEIAAQENLALKDGEPLIHPVVEPADVPEEAPEEAPEEVHACEATEAPEATEEAAEQTE